MKIVARIILISTVFAVLGNTALAQNDTSEEDLIVIDDLSRAELRAEIEKIENAFYRVFNANIDDEKLKVECSDYTPTGSRIEQRACEPKFVVDARNENVRNWQNVTDVLLTSEDLQAGLGSEFEELTVAMNQVLQKDQYFRELNSILKMLRGRLAELDD